MAEFRELDDKRFLDAKTQMRSAEDIPAAVALLSEIYEENRTGGSDLARCRSLWERGECLQLFGIHADRIDETLSAFHQAEQDFRAAVESSPEWFAHQIADHRWFPENSFIVPAYRSLLDSFGDRSHAAQGNVAEVLKNMGMEASSALESLRRVRGVFRGWADSAIERITRIESGEKLPFASLRLAVEREIQIYPTDQDQFPDDQMLSDDDVRLPEWELAGLLNSGQWANRAKAACILRFTVPEPDASVVDALFRLLESGEKRAIVRGQCARTLGHYAARGNLRAEDSERLTQRLKVLLTSDPAYPVRAIAAEVLSSIGSDRPDVRERLVEAFRNSGKEDANVQRTLVQAIGAFGPSARDLLPLVIAFQPHERDTTGEVIKAAAILRITPPGEQDRTRSMTTFIESLRRQPFAAPLQTAREVRKAALGAIQTVPILEAFRKKLLIERMVFDDSAQIRVEAAQVLMNLDRDLAVQAGAPAVLRRLGF